MTPDSSPPNVSLRDIAAKLGVSHSTVSLALRDHPRISQAMKDRVRKAAEEMGYRPDPMLAALANYRRGRAKKPISAAVAWINAWPEPDELRTLKEFEFYWQGAHKAAEKFGYRLEEFRLGRECTPRRLHQILSTRGIRGLMLPPHRVQPDWQDFPWNEYSVIRLGRSLHEPACHIVTADQIANTILAVQRIHQRGYQRIGFITIEGDFRQRGMLFELGYRGGQRLIRDPDPLPPLVQRKDDIRNRKKVLKQWMETHKPDAIFATDPTVSNLLEQIGYKIPDNVGFATSSILDTHVDSGIDQHPEEIGRVGFLMLNSLINDRSQGIPDIFRQLLVEGSWVDGSSMPDRS